MLQTIEGFHLEPTNICTLKCSGCARTRFIDRWPEHWKNHSLDIDSVLSFLDLVLSGKHIHLCGNYGDPIYHSDLINFVSKLKQAGTRIVITTNGSYKSLEWWQELTLHLDSQDTVRFSIDGVPNNFTQNRKNADWTSTLTAIETCVASSCQTVWKYIPFSYNQHSVEQAKRMCWDLGMDTFLLDPSDRFDELTADLLPIPRSTFRSQRLGKTSCPVARDARELSPCPRPPTRLFFIEHVPFFAQHFKHRFHASLS